MIKNRKTIHHSELIQAYVDRHNVEWNDACQEIGDQEFLGMIYLDNIETEEDIMEYGYANGYRLVRDLMIEAGVDEVTVLKD